jgi:hypothetical protein
MAAVVSSMHPHLALAELPMSSAALFFQDLRENVADAAASCEERPELRETADHGAVHSLPD